MPGRAGQAGRNALTVPRCGTNPSPISSRPPLGRAFFACVQILRRQDRSAGATPSAAGDKSCQYTNASRGVPRRSGGASPLASKGGSKAPGGTSSGLIDALGLYPSANSPRRCRFGRSSAPCRRLRRGIGVTFPRQRRSRRKLATRLRSSSERRHRNRESQAARSFKRFGRQVRRPSGRHQRVAGPACRRLP